MQHYQTDGEALKLQSMNYMTTKMCSLCKEVKEIETCFHKHGKHVNRYCKVCRCNVEKERRQNNLEKYKQKDKEYHLLNKSERNARSREYTSKNREELNAKARERYQKNKEKVREYHQERKVIRNQVKKERLLNNPSSRIKERLVARMSELLKGKRRHRISKLTNCSSNELCLWLESQFHNDMDWNNYGKYWHIDHVVPVSFFDLEHLVQQEMCFHWFNLRPLQASLNMSKSNKILQDDIVSHLQVVKSYCSKLERYQTDYDSSWWRRLELRYGKNPEDEECFEDILKWVIRSQKPLMTEGKAQRLNDSG